MYILLIFNCTLLFITLVIYYNSLVLERNSQITLKTQCKSNKIIDAVIMFFDLKNFILYKFNLIQKCLNSWTKVFGYHRIFVYFFPFNLALLQVSNKIIITLIPYTSENYIAIYSHKLICIFYRILKCTYINNFLEPVNSEKGPRACQLSLKLVRRIKQHAYAEPKYLESLIYSLYGESILLTKIVSWKMTMSNHFFLYTTLKNNKLVFILRF